jgi:tetratricopeptide (TPR) repeat protein
MTGEERARKDFFISFTSSDRKWATWIAWVLEQKGYTCAFQDWDFTPGCNFVAEMDRALKDCDRVLAVLSPKYCSSGFCEAEWTAKFAEGVKSKKPTILPVRVCEFDVEGLLGVLVYVDLVNCSKEQARNLLLKRVQDGRAKPDTEPGFPGELEDASPRFPGDLPPHWNVPHNQNPNFTGREDLLDSIWEARQKRRATALVQTFAGLGGVGKTQLATEYAYRHLDDYDVIWWVRSEETSQLASDYAGLAYELGEADPNESDQRPGVEAAKRWLEHNDGWLLIFDNANCKEDIAGYIPRGRGGNVIITSRDSNWKGIADSLSVKQWPRPDSVAFLQNRTFDKDTDAINELAGLLGDLPLALEQAAAYMEDTSRPVAEYLELFKTRRAELLAEGELSTDYHDTVATTWNISFQAVQEAMPEAADLMNLLAFLAPDDIPRKMIADNAKFLPEELAPLAADPIQLDKALAVLRRYSLIELAPDSVSVHRLVQAVIRDELSEDECQQWIGVALDIVDAAFIYKMVDVTTWPVCERLSPHVTETVDRACARGIGSDKTGRLLNRLGLYFKERAQFRQAKSHLERALKITEAALGPDHPSVATRLSNLGGVLQDLGELQAAKSHLERALKIGEAALGPDHPSVAIRLSNLGLVLKDLGELQAAKSHLERALKIGEAALGSDHPSVAIRLSNLGTVLRNLGELQTAKSHLERALKIDEAALGPDHPNVANRLCNLGTVQKDLGNLSTARGYLTRSLDICNRVYGADHPNTRIVRANLQSLDSKIAARSESGDQGANV